MNETTLGVDHALEEAFAAFVQAQENGQVEAARQLLRAHPGLAEEAAMFYALCGRVPKPWDSSAASYAGRMIGDFELLHELGRGGEGVVYKARQKSLQAVVAVKVMRPERFAQNRDVERVRRDSILLASLDHPNIVRILYAGESEAGPYFAMELMAGGSLKEKLADGWLPTPKQAAELVRVLAAAMQCAHEQGIVHRDLKPANILFKPDDTPKIVDFGLAKKLDAGESMTQLGAIVGTASYMAPEQAKGQRAEFASDIYGLGAILYELLTGRPPFVGTSLLDTLEQVREKEPSPVRQLNPNVPRDLEVICLKCLDKASTKRYPSVAELAADLQRFLRGEAILARLPGITEKTFRILLRQQFTNAAAWGWIFLSMSAVHTIGYSVLAWSVASMQSWAIYWTIIIGHALFVPILIWRGLRNCRLEAGDRQLISFAIAMIVGSWLLSVFQPPYKGMEETALRVYLFPLRALLQGCLLFVMGAVYWGGFYLFGIGWVLVGFVMLLHPDFSIVLYGLYTVSLQVPLGLYLLRLGKSPDVRK